MAVFYSLVHYVPNVIADERIAIGFVVFWQRGVAARFVSNWKRIKCFASGVDIEFLRTFAEGFDANFVASTYLQIPEKGPIADTDVHRLSRDWHHSIQLTKPRASLADPQKLIAQLERQVLGRVSRSRSLSKEGIVQDAVAKLRDELTKRTTRDVAYDSVRTHEHLTGKVDHHGFDITVANGRPLLAARVLSVPATGAIHANVIGDLAWAFRDMRDRWPDISLTAILTKDRAIGPAIVRVRTIASAVDATVVGVSAVSDWVREQAAVTAPPLLRH